MKSQILSALRKEWVNCEGCKLHRSRKNVVFGDGNPDADILVVGEAPGAEENSTGDPFQGDAGKILDEFLENCGLDRATDCYVTNIVACRPIALNIDDRTGKRKIDNRVPSKSERQACWSRLWQIIYTIDPLLIVTVGKVPLQALTSKSTKMSKMRGRVQTMTLHGHVTDIRYPVMPIYNTAFLSRNHDHVRPEGPWGKTADDFIEICKIIDHLRVAYYDIKPPDRWGRKKRGKKES